MTVAGEWSYSTGIAVALENVTIAMPRCLPAGGKARLIISAHGGSEQAATMVNEQSGAGYKWNDLCAYTAAGFIVLFPDLGSTVYPPPSAGFGTGGGHGLVNFGNDEAIASYGNYWTWAKANLPVKTDKLIVAGGSMGTVTAMNWARQNVSQCKAVVISNPLVDLYLIYSTNVLQHQGDVAQAYGLGGDGVGYDPPVPAGSFTGLPTHSMAIYTENNPSDVAGIPIGCWASDNDPDAYNTAECQAWAATINALGADVSVFSVGAQGHNCVGFSNPKVAWLQSIGAG